MAETVVTGTKTPHAADEAPVPTQVITKEEITATQAGGIDAVLSLIPDIYVHQNEQFGLGASTIRMQGADPNKVLILLDGQRFLGGVDGVVDLRDIPAINIEQIEIMRGPASSLYGSDAMAGVINIRTRSGGDPLYLAGTAAGGSFGRQLYNAAIGADAGPVRLFVSGQHDEVQIAELLGPISAQFEDSKELQKRDTAFLRLDYPTVVAEPPPRGQLRAGGQPAQREQGPRDRPRVERGTRRRAGRSTSPAAATASTARTTSRASSRTSTTRAGSGKARTTWAAGRLGPTDHVLVVGHARPSRGHRVAVARRIGGDTDGFAAPEVDEGTYQLSPFLQDEIAIWRRADARVGSSFDKHSEFGLAVNPRATLT